MKRTSILIKYNPEGDSLWSRKYITPDTLNYGGCGYVDLDNYRNIIISGSEIRKYDENGNLLLNIDKNQLMQLGLHELGGGRTINFQNNIYFSNYGFFDCLTLGFNNSGINIFNQRYPEHMLSYNVVCKNFDKYKNSLILVCKSPGPGTNVKDSCVIIKYSVPTYIKNISSNQEINYHLYQNYPNPFNSRTKIEFHLPNMTFAEIKLYDISGREISVLLKTQLPEGRHGVVFDSGELASGTYFYSLFAGNKIQATKKLIVLK